MADVIPVFTLDYQCTDSNGDPNSGGTIEFYAAGTSTPRVVYADPGLTTSLGSTVSLNADGRPVSGSSLVTVYTGDAAFKFIVKDSDGVTMRSFDNLPGAFDTSGLAETGDVTGLGTGYVATQTISADDTMVADDEGHVVNVNPSGGSRTITLPSAVTVGDGWPITIRHDGTANSVIIATVSSQVIQHAGADVQTLALNERGESVTLVSDATGWIVAHHSSGGIVGRIPDLLIEAIQSSPPGSPTPGQTYIIGSTPSGGWSARAEHDVARWSGGEWLYWTPPTDSGWRAYNKDNNTNYQFQASAWVALAGAVGAGLTQTAGAFAVTFADAADMEAATETDEAVVPSLQHRHPGHAKAAANIQGSGTAAILWDYGLASLTDNGTGDHTVALDTAFSSTAFAATAWARGDDTNGDVFCSAPAAGTKTISSLQIYTRDAAGNNRDVADIGLALFGDQ